MATPSYNRRINKDAPKEKQLDALVKALELATYSITICSNDKVFEPKFRGAMTNDLINTAKNIYLDAWEANNIFVNDDPLKWQMRRSKQEAAVSGCNRLLALMQIAGRVFHLYNKKVNYWFQLTTDTRTLFRAWMESDRKRYGDLK